MKKTILILGCVVLILSIGCKKSSDNNTTTKITYTTDVKPILNANCATSGCHVTGGQFPDLSNYSDSKTNVDDIISRMSLNTTDGGFMPQGGTKVQANIDKITKWKTDGLNQ